MTDFSADSGVHFAGTESILLVRTPRLDAPFFVAAMNRQMNTSEPATKSLSINIS
jgi:hypothetical protein